MGEVDPDDDTVWRWVLNHYRFDPSRRERRNVAVAAFDNEAEFRVEFDRYVAELRSDIAAGHRSERENVSGIAKEPGYSAAQARGRDVGRAIRHGVDPAPLLAGGPLPTNMALLSLRSIDAASPEDDRDPPARRS